MRAPALPPGGGAGAFRLVQLVHIAMLFADKRALETNLKVNLLAIREKELNYYVRMLPPSTHSRTKQRASHDFIDLCISSAC